jgi:hypothetical protein
MGRDAGGSAPAAVELEIIVHEDRRQQRRLRAV